jgi:hypothetical protein
MLANAEPRYRKRLPCQVKIGGSAHEGWIVNLSRTGLFVQTAAGAGPGEMIEVALQRRRPADLVPAAAPSGSARSLPVAPDDGAWRRSIRRRSPLPPVEAVERLQTQLPRDQSRKVSDPEPTSHDAI